MIIEKGKGDGFIFYKKFGPDFLGETFRVVKEKEAMRSSLSRK
jgi:hypothetical protein